MQPKRTYISFDYAMKKLLRNKANFGILEGFLSTLLEFEVVVEEILESESNSEKEDDKNVRFDLLCKDPNDQFYIIELQYYHQIDYFQRILFGTSKLISEQLEKGSPYEKVKKVYSVNILYFDLGQGKDYVYHGKTSFVGLHQKDSLQLSSGQRNYFNKNEVYELYPEYFLLKVNNFDDLAKDSLDEWIYFLKNSELPKRYKAKGLKEVDKKLKYEKMSQTEQTAYDKHIEGLMISESELKTARYEGRLEGERKGRLEGERKGKLESIVNAFEEGLELAMISKIFKISENEVEQILKDKGLI